MGVTLLGTPKMVVSLFEAHFEFSLTAREAVFWKSAVPAVPFSARVGS